MAAGDLTTLTAVKAWLPIPSGTTSEDALLSGLITSTSADFLRATKRPDLLTATYTGEVREGDGSSRMILRHWPITAVASLTIGGASISASTDRVASGYYFDVDLDPERLWELWLAVYSFTDGAPVVVTYTAGYATVPSDIAQAVVDWVVYRYKGRPNVGTTTRRTTEGSDVHLEQVDAPPTTLSVIERYTRVIPSLDRRDDERQERVAKPAFRRVPKP